MAKGYISKLLALHKKTSANWHCMGEVESLSSPTFLHCFDCFFLTSSEYVLHGKMKNDEFTFVSNANP